MIPPDMLNQIVTGDARELAKRIPDESVDLIYTDPPYPAEFEHVWWDMGEYAARVLRPGASLITLCGHYQVPMAIRALTAHGLRYHWIGWMVHNGAKSTSMAFRTVRGGKPYLWISKGAPVIKHGFFWDTKTEGQRDKRFHEWGQRAAPTQKDILTLTNVGDLVLDPFCGGGTTAAVCKQTYRNFITFEIDPDTAERARLRLQQTQPPLPGLVYETPSFLEVNT